MASSERYQRYFKVSWDRLQNDIRDLCKDLEGRTFKGIIAIARGGLIPTGLFAQEMGLRNIDTLCVQSYDAMSQRDGVTVDKGVEHDGEGWLLIDDLVDTGKTARIVREMLPKALFVTVYAKPEGRPLVDRFHTEVPQDTWVVFPWEPNPPADA